MTYIILMSWQKRGDELSPRTGRPTDNKKDIKFQIRIDKQTLDELDECAKAEKSSRSEIIRKGIKLVKAENEKKK